MALAFHLHHDPDKTLLHPGRKRLASEKGVDGKSAAVHFAPFHGEVLIGAARVTADHFEAQTESVFEHARNIVSAAANAGGRTTRRLTGIADIVQSFIRRIRAHEEQKTAALRRADPGQFIPIVFHLAAADQLGEVQRPANGAHRQSVLLGDVVDVIGGNHAAGTGHVLHEKVRITGNILAQVAGVGARPLIVRVAGLIADDNADGLALVIIPLRE